MSTIPPEHPSYYEKIRAEEDAVRDALGHVSAEVDAGRITVKQAADERVRLLQAHLERLHQIRAEHLGETP